MVYGLHVENFADSLYFLGFLWTLVALIRALRGQELTSQTVFPAFGYALVTTAAGMLSRLLVIQFQETIPDQLADTQRDIEADLLALRDALRGARSELTALQVATEDTAAHISDNFRKA